MRVGQNYSPTMRGEHEREGIRPQQGRVAYGFHAGTRPVADPEDIVTGKEILKAAKVAGKTVKVK